MILTGPEIRNLVNLGRDLDGKKVQEESDRGPNPSYKNRVDFPVVSIDVLSTREYTDCRMNYIDIDPYDPELVGPNSVDLRLGDSLLMYKAGLLQHQRFDDELRRLNETVEARPDLRRSGLEFGINNMTIGCPPLDMRDEAHPSYKVAIPKEGMVLWPGVLYLGRTIETIGSNSYVPIVEGRSSVGRLGIHVHVTAGFCDIGFRGTITLEIHVVHPVRIYPNIPICQAYFLEPAGAIELYKGRYQDQVEPTPSRFGIEKKK